MLGLCTFRIENSCVSHLPANLPGSSGCGLYRRFSLELFPSSLLNPHARIASAPHNRSKLPPHILEIVEALFALQPFGGAYRSFSEAAAGFGVVAEIDAVVIRFEDDFVQADDFAFAEGSDFEVGGAAGGHFAAGFADQILQGEGSAGGGIFFARVVALEDLSGVVVAECCGRGAGCFVEEIDADGKVSGIEEAGFVLVDESTDPVEFSIPS